MMRRCVTDEQYGQLSRRAGELVRRIDEGTLPFQQTMDKLQVLIQSSCKTVCINVNSTVPFDQDMTKKGWTLESDAKFQDGEVTLELVSFLQEGESCSGDEMVKRTQDNVVLGQRHAEELLRNQDKIPEEWREYVLLFPGSVWRGSRDDRRVPYLLWDGDRWCLYFYWLVRGFDSNCRVICSRK